MRAERGFEGHSLLVVVKNNKHSVYCIPDATLSAFNVTDPSGAHSSPPGRCHQNLFCEV